MNNRNCYIYYSSCVAILICVALCSCHSPYYSKLKLPISEIKPMIIERDSETKKDVIYTENKNFEIATVKPINSDYETWLPHPINAWKKLEEGTVSVSGGAFLGWSGQADFKALKNIDKSTETSVNLIEDNDLDFEGGCDYSLRYNYKMFYGGFRFSRMRASSDDKLPGQYDTNYDRYSFEVGHFIDIGERELEEYTRGFYLSYL